MATIELQQQAHRRTADLIRRELARRDVNDFCEYAMTGPQGSPWMQQPFHREWQELLPLQGPYRLLIGAPRESAKTSQMAIARVIWELGRNPDLRVKIVTASDNLAGDIVAAIARHIAANPRVHEVFPRLKPASAGLWPKPGAQTNRLMVARTSKEKDPSVAGYGVMSAGVGGRADLIIFDDVVRRAGGDRAKLLYIDDREDLIKEATLLGIDSIWFTDIDTLKEKMKEKGVLGKETQLTP